MSTLNWENFVAVRNCTHKKRFDSEAHCLDSIEKTKTTVQLYPYKCKLCGYWHKTKHSPQNYKDKAL